MTKHIKTIEELVEKLSSKEFCEKYIQIHVTMGVQKIKNKMILERNSVTFIVPGMKIAYFVIFDFFDKRKYFLYLDKENLTYTRDSIIKDYYISNRIILEKPTYDEVYDFLCSYYFCPLNLNKDKYKSINNIFKRRSK